MSERERLGVWNPIEELTYSQEGLDTISQDLRGKINEEYGNLERQLEELDKDNRALLDSNLELIKELDEAREVIKRVEDLATGYYCQKSEYEQSVEIPYWDIIFALNIKEQDK